MDDIKLVIGSWGSYNECNDRALGSKWLNLSDYDSWDEIENELNDEGFELNGIDEELFVQDIEGLDTKNNWDYENPKELFELLQEAEVLTNDNKYETMQAYLQIRDFNEFEELVNSKGCHWDDDINLYKGYDWSDYGREMYECCYEKIPDELEQFIDFEAYGKYIGDYAVEEYDDGLIEIR